MEASYLKKLPMKQIWSPWRMKYIQQHSHSASCIFCDALRQEDNAENLIVCRAQHSFLILNRYPYNNGHVMVVPYEHHPSIELLQPATRAELLEMVSRIVIVLRELYAADGFNIGINIGSAAGAGVAGHVHMHVVPRWNGDTNFISTVSSVRVLPEDLGITYQRIRATWQRLGY